MKLNKNTKVEYFCTKPNLISLSTNFNLDPIFWTLKMLHLSPIQTLIKPNKNHETFEGKLLGKIRPASGFSQKI